MSEKHTGELQKIFWQPDRIVNKSLQQALDLKHTTVKSLYNLPCGRRIVSLMMTIGGPNTVEQK
jgi:hypothetical protein